MGVLIGFQDSPAALPAFSHRKSAARRKVQYVGEYIEIFSSQLVGRLGER